MTYDLKTAFPQLPKPIHINITEFARRTQTFKDYTDSVIDIGDEKYHITIYTNDDISIFIKDLGGRVVGTTYHLKGELNIIDLMAHKIYDQIKQEMKEIIINERTSEKR